MIIAGSADTYVSEQRTRASSVLDPASILSRRFEIGFEYYKPLSLGRPVRSGWLREIRPDQVRAQEVFQGRGVQARLSGGAQARRSWT